MRNLMKEFVVFQLEKDFSTVRGLGRRWTQAQAREHWRALRDEGHKGLELRSVKALFTANGFIVADTPQATTTHDPRAGTETSFGVRTGD